MQPRCTPPLGLGWRSSYWFATFVVGLGIATDFVVYSIIIPVLPFQLERLEYTGVSALVGWLLFAYSAGLVLSTIPIAMLSERYNARRWPLIIGLIILIGSQILLMEAPTYWLMCIARILQGVGSSMVWVVGLALLCDITPEKFIGRQLGIAMAGLSIGSIIGPPVGGALYTRFGFRGPFIFGIIIAVFDLIGRLLVIERKEAMRWDSHATAFPENDAKPGSVGITGNDESKQQGTRNLSRDDENVSSGFPLEVSLENGGSALTPPRMLSLPAVIIQLAKSSRAGVSLFITFAYGIVYASQEPALPLHLQARWGLDSSRVGLVFLAAVVPTIVSGPLTGYYTDRKGSEWVTFLSLVLALPWWAVVIIQGKLALFIASFALAYCFTSGVISPVTAELAAVSRDIEGIGYAHVYGAFNLIYGIGTSVGPVIGGQIYDHLRNGWTALCLIATGLLVLSVLLAFCYIGDDPLSRKLIRSLKPRREQP